ncbi:HPF/RaiA family ribosome-associated protein [Pseudonocardia benzenivorans]|uniref:HPF/RaiA family ribosome-associated protein n=2 Tax=Pseudonocardia TaxID=1847 RepID=A0ABW3VK23_9PSEU|nr:hypothetical protein PSD17_06170 [Pseudonocardia sp. D17]
MSAGGTAEESLPTVGDGVVAPEPQRPAARPVVVLGHGLTVSASQRAHVIDKMSNLQRHDDAVDSFEVHVFRERNPRQAKLRDRVEISGFGPGFTLSVQARGSGFHPAFAAALVKLEARLHRHRDRRLTRDHSGGHQNPVVNTTA